MLLAIERINGGIGTAGIHFNKPESPGAPGSPVVDKIYPENFTISGKELTNFLFTPTER